jgi:pyrroloquinoline-quinone synthase
MEVDEALVKLGKQIEEYDLLTHPFYQAWSAGELTRKDLEEYATEYYHHVAAFPTYLSTLHSLLPSGPLRRAVLRNLCDEEITGVPHSELWLDFAEGIGIDRGSVKARIPLPEVQELMARYRDLMQSPPAALAALYAYESQVPRISKEKAKSLAERYGADARTCRYFELHRLVDRHHALIWKTELTNLLVSEPSLSREALNGAKAAAEALWGALDGIEATRQERNRTAGTSSRPSHPVRLGEA